MKTEGKTPTEASREAMRRAIALACGWTRWKWTRGQSSYTMWSRPGVYVNPRLPEDYTHSMVYDPPDYLNDLNAIHEAEGVLRDDDEGIGSRWAFIQELIEITGAESMEVNREVFIVTHATALQRATAFCKTLSLLKE